MNDTTRTHRIFHTEAVVPPLPASTEAREQPVTVHFMASETEYVESIWAIKSFYHYSKVKYPLVFHCQGYFSSDKLAAIRGHFPTARIVTDEEARDLVESELGKRSLNGLLAIRRREFLFRKLLDFTLFGETPNLLSFDPDVLFFRKPSELILEKSEPLDYALFQEDCFDAYTIGREDAEKDLGINLCPRLNCGIILRARQWTSFEFLEQLIQHPVFREKHWHNEQTTHALVASSLGQPRKLPRSYLLSMEPDPKPRSMIARHYCTPVRPEFYREGLDLLEKGGFLEELDFKGPPSVPDATAGSNESPRSRIWPLHFLEPFRRSRTTCNNRHLRFETPTYTHPVDRVHIVLCARDVEMAKACVASVKFWHPELKIVLVKDLTKGDFDLREFEQHWECKVQQIDHGRHGWGLGKIAVLTQPDQERTFLLDPDIILAGPVLNLLRMTYADFTLSVYQSEDNFDPDIYYDIEKVREFDPEFTYPGYYFNSGQMLATTGILKREDFETLMDFNEPCKVHSPETFPCVDQSLLNYVLPRAEKAGRLSVCKMEFLVWGWRNLDSIDYFSWRNGIGFPYLVHWAGDKPANLDDMNGSHLWKFFEYYFRTRKIPPPRLMTEWFENRTIEIR